MALVQALAPVVEYWGLQWQTLLLVHLLQILVGFFFVWLSFTLDDFKNLNMCIGKKETYHLPLVLETPYL